MGWNDIHITLAPIGSQVSVWTDPRTITATGEPVKIVRVQPSEQATADIVLHSDVVGWIAHLGFRLVRSHTPNFEYVFRDVTLNLTSENGAVTSVTATFLVNLEVRAKIGTWKKLIEELCDRFGLILVDPENGIVEANEFQRLVEASFAWKCFLQREKQKAN